MKKYAWLLLGALAVVQPVLADELTQLKEKLVKEVPELQNAEISKTPIAGIYAVQQGAFVFYTSADAKYVLRGELLSLSDKRNLTDEMIMKFRETELNNLADKDTMIFMPASGKYTHTITVFTDVDCPYCHKLHSQLNKVLDAGIRVRYAFFPREGLTSPSYQKAVHAWCNRDKPNELSLLMQGATPAKLQTCENPIKNHFALAGKLGIQGTPSIVLPDGDLIPGLVPIDELIKVVKAQAK